ncbi:MAG: protein kinase domain-containing protein [Planctomycetales bacterium]
MSDTSSSQTSGTSSLLERVLADYLYALESGRTPDRQALLDAHPELADELQAFFRNRDSIAKVAEPLQAAVDAPTLLGISSPVPASTGSLVQYFGDYELLEEIARGGMGVVYKARQVNLNRIVALKMILAGQLANDSEVKRFHAEAEAAARLDHPGIVPIYEIGQHDGQHYFSMAFIEGTSLAKKVSDGPLPARDAAELLRKVTLAVQFAHDKGIVHRDLKPANVLLDAAGLPRVTDFGLAKQMHGDSELTGTGQVLGTPSYMPPEQAAGHLDRIGPASDVYSLGAILYCLLTGRPPFQAAGPMDTLLQVLEHDPVAPTQLNPRIPPDLETICLKCLEKSPHQRYATAGELAQELDRFLRGEPILARPISRLERGWRWCKRQPLVAGLVAAVALSLVAGIVVSGFFAVEAGRRAQLETDARKAEQAQREEALQQREQAEKERAVAVAERDEKEIARAEAERAQQAREQALQIAKDEQDQKTLALVAAQRERIAADAARKQAEELLYFNRIGLAFQYWLADNLPQSRRMLDLCPAEQRGWEWRYLDRLHQGELAVLQGNGQFTTGLTFSHDGTRLAAFARTGDAGLRVWDVPGRKGLAEVNLTRQQRSFCAGAMSDDGRTLALSDRAGGITLWDAETGLWQRELAKLTRGAAGLALSPDGKYLAAALVDGRNGERLLAFTEPALNEELIVWEVESGAEVFRPKGFGVAAMFSPDGSRLLTFKVNKGLRLTPSTPETTVALFDTSSWTQIAEGQLGTARCFCFSADSQRFALGGRDRRRNANFVRVHASATGEELAALAPNRIVGDVALSASGTSVAVVESLGSAKIDIWDVKQQQLVRTLHGHTGSLNAIAWSSRGELASSSWDFTVRLWDPASSPLVARSPGLPVGHIEQAQFSPGTKWLAFAQPNSVNVFTGPIKTITLVDPLGINRKQVLPGHDQGTLKLAYSDDGSRLASGGRKGDVKIWDLAAGKELRAYRGHDGQIVALALSPDGLRGVSAHEPPEVTQQRIGQAPFNAIPVAVKVWDATTGQEQRTLEGHPGGVYQLAFSPDGRLVATAGHPVVKIWNVETGTPIRDLEASDLVGGAGDKLTFTPDGRFLATAGSGTVQVWDVATGRAVVNFRGHGSGRIDGLAFSADTRRLATASEREVKLWDVASGQEILTLPLAEPGTPESAPVAALSWSADGQRLHAALRDGSFLAWSASR